jgi:hypothetical protein
MLLPKARPEGVSIVWVRCGFFVVLALPLAKTGGTKQAAEERCLVKSPGARFGREPAP